MSSNQVFPVSRVCQSNAQRVRHRGLCGWVEKVLRDPHLAQPSMCYVSLVFLVEIEAPERSCCCVIASKPDYNDLVNA